MGPPGKSAVDVQFCQPFVGEKVSSNHRPAYELALHLAT